MDKIKLVDNTEVEVISIIGGKQTIQGVNRPTIDIHISASELTFDQVNTLFNPSNTKSLIVIESVGEAQQQFLHEGYAIRVKLALQPVEISPATYESPAAYEDRYVVTLAQETYIERQISQLLAQ